MKLQRGTYQIEGSHLEVQILNVPYQNDKYAKIKINLLEEGWIFESGKPYKIYKNFITHWTFKGKI